ncbi:MAG: polysaccharide deacetylase family protein [Pseudomonadota bacterium]
MLASPTLSASRAHADPWTALDAELDRWRGAGQTATFWWRDDDATAPGPALDRLLGLADRYAAPVGLAVIPRDATEALAGRLAASTNVGVLQHGWAHRNHAGPGEKKMELGDHRPASLVGDELRAGFDRLSALFGSRFLPALVPPWNRIGASVGFQLAEIGFTGLSLFGARAHRLRDGLVLANTHVDPIAWRQDRGFTGTDAALATLVGHLSDRRDGLVDPGEPTGLLTHHLAHDEATWAFLERCLEALASHSAARLLPPDTVFDASDS